MISKAILPTFVLLWCAAVEPAAARSPEETGQGAFAAIAEISNLLLEDEATDWSRVSLLALREHLVDMNEVVLRAQVEERAIEKGVAIVVSGTGRTLEALRRMVPMHSRMMQGYSGWQVAVDSSADGFEIELTTDEAGDVARLRGLGFFGFLASGDHHRRHHLGVAAGTMSHHGHHGSP